MNMAWLWPWRVSLGVPIKLWLRKETARDLTLHLPAQGDESSTATFEKTLSTLATKITNTQSDLDATRSRSRRVKVLTTLYLSFAYVVYAIVVALVIGYRNLGAYEWTALSGGPVT